MPLLDVTYPAGTFTDESRTALVEELSARLLRAEGAPDTEFFRSITWVHLHELPAEAVCAAGHPVTAPTFKVVATVPQGALPDERKAKFIAEATSVISEAAGLSQGDGLRVWVLINEVPEGSWGAGGEVVRFEQLRQIAQRERETAGAA
jgi:phenylpyruvate tautomerase PptA (4-oxalocrotonate tautomerase family)